MTTGSDFYAWNPIYFQSIDPETGKYSGNVIGNVSLEDQLAIVDRAGEKQKTDIRALGKEQAKAIQNLAEKFVSFWSIADQVEKAVIGSNPPQRSKDTEFIEDFIENYVPPTVDTEETGPASSDESTAQVSSGAEYYVWTPNHLKVLNLETGKYFGTLIGNVPMFEQIQTVSNEGAKQKTDIIELGTSETTDIMKRSEKFRQVIQLNRNTMKEVVVFFGGVFVLNSSALDGSPLG